MFTIDVNNIINDQNSDEDLTDVYPYLYEGCDVGVDSDDNNSEANVPPSPPLHHTLEDILPLIEIAGHDLLPSLISSLDEEYGFGAIPFEENEFYLAELFYQILTRYKGLHTDANRISNRVNLGSFDPNRIINYVLSPMGRSYKKFSGHKLLHPDIMFSLRYPHEINPHSLIQEESRLVARHLSMIRESQDQYDSVD